jgi:hypothetical protein
MRGVWQQRVGDDVIVSEGTGNDSVLAAGKGDGALHRDDGNDALCGDVDSNTPCGGGGLDACFPDGNLVLGGALSVGYRNTCGLGKSIRAGLVHASCVVDSHQRVT